MLKWIVIAVFAAIAVTGIVGVVKTVRAKADTPKEVYSPKLMVYITLAVIFSIMTIMTSIFSK